MKKLILALLLIPTPALATIDATIVDYGMHEYLIPAIERTYEWDDTITQEHIVSFAQCQVDVILREVTTDKEAARAIVDMAEYTDYNSGFKSEIGDMSLTDQALVDGYYNCLPDVV